MTMEPEQGRGGEVPERWSVKAKSEVVLRLFRGEAVEVVSREVQVPVHEIESWRRAFLEAGQAGLRSRQGEPEDRAIKQAQAKVGEFSSQALARLPLEKGQLDGVQDQLERQVKRLAGSAAGGLRLPKL